MPTGASTAYYILAYCSNKCRFLMVDFDETSRSYEHDKVEISAYERIKVIFFMTKTFHIMAGCSPEKN